MGKILEAFLNEQLYGQQNRGRSLGQQKSGYRCKNLKQVVFSCKETHHLIHASATKQTTGILYSVRFCLARNNLKRKDKYGNTDNNQRILK